VSDLSRLVSPLRQAGGTQQSHDASVVPLSQVVHPLVACDVCDRPIVGVRYKCGSVDTDVLLNFCSSFVEWDDNMGPHSRNLLGKS